mgnify:CR=1 FL=1
MPQLLWASIHVHADSISKCMQFKIVQGSWVYGIRINPLKKGSEVCKLPLICFKRFLDCDSWMSASGRNGITSSSFLISCVDVLWFWCCDVEGYDFYQFCELLSTKHSWEKLWPLCLSTNKVELFGDKAVCSRLSVLVFWVHFVAVLVILKSHYWPAP